MPKIGKFKADIKGARCEFVIWYDDKKKFYLKDFPSDIEKISESYSWGYPSLQNLEESVKTMIDLYHERTKTQRKVIAYSLQLSGAMFMNKVREGEYQGIMPWCYDKDSKISRPPFGSNEFTIGLDYRIYMEVQVKNLQYYRIMSDGKLGYKEDSSKFKDWNIIDWTQEREDGLERITKSMQELAKKMGSVLLDPEKTISLLESGLKILGGGNE